MNITILAIILANMVGFAVYLVYPVAFPRPQLGNSLAEMVLSLEHATGFQPGANKLPSLHVAFAWFVYFACRGQKLNKFGESLIFLIAVTITLSTLFLKQHIIIDAITGIVLAGLMWKLAKYLYPIMVDPEATPRDALKKMLLKTGIVFIYFMIFWISIPFLLWAIGYGMNQISPLKLPGHPATRICGMFIMIIGLAVCLYVMKHLIDRGRGLPVSHIPPDNFVSSGPYRHSRHPLYVGYTVAWVGFAMTVSSFWMLTLSLAILILGWLLYVHFLEEPVLLKRFGIQYERYRERTPIFTLKYRRETI